MNTGIEATDNTGMLPMLWVLGLMAAVVMLETSPNPTSAFASDRLVLTLVNCVEVRL